MANLLVISYAEAPTLCICLRLKSRLEYEPDLSSLLSYSATSRTAREVAMDKKASPKSNKSPQTSPEAPSTTFIQLDGRSPVPSQFHTPGTFTITRLQSPAGLPDQITKLSPVPALLVSIPLSLCHHRAIRCGHCPPIRAGRPTRGRHWLES